MSEKIVKTKIPTVEELLLAGAHFGHQTRRWNPKMAPFVYKVQQGVHIIDLYKTHDHLQKAADFLKDVAAKGGQVIFVGTKGQAREIVQNRATESGALFVVERWLGGTLTNFHEIKKRLDYLKDYYKKSEANAFTAFTKKERLLMSREAEKMHKVLGGILTLNGRPGAVVVIDPHREHIVVRECLRLNIPIVALADTNCDPTGINYIIPANDDAIKAIELVVTTLAEAVKGGYGIAGISVEASKLIVETQHAASKAEPKPTSVETSDISTLKLSNRSVNALNKAGITTVEELKKTDLATIKGLGAKSVDEIKKAIKS